VLSLQGVEKGYGERVLLHGVSLVLGESDRIGLVGPNGTGKSTLLKILAGVEEPDAGRRIARKDLRPAYLEQEPRLAGATVREAIRAGRDAGAHEVEAVADRLGLDVAAACGGLSGGERRRVALARVLLDDPDVLLLDEPTNHLDAFITAWLEKRLIDTRKPLVMVTHDRYFLDRIATRIVELDRGALYASEGGYDAFLEARTARLASERKTESSRLNILRRERAWIRRGPKAQRTKDKARIRRYEALVDAAPDATAEDLDLLIPPGPHLGTKVIRLHDVAHAHGGLRDVNLEIGRGERIGIVGANGAGKTTLLDLCLGRLAPEKGRVELGPTVRFAHIDQARDGLDESHTVLRAIAGENVHVSLGERKIRIEAFLDRFLFPAAMHRTPVGKLSGGERNRVLLAKLLVQGGNVLALDEPTNDLDLNTLRALEEALVAFPGTVLVVSHDRWFLDRVATTILHVRDGGIRAHPGDMSSLLEALEAEAPPSRKETAPKPAAARAAPRKLGYREQRELDALPDRIAAAEAEVARLDEALADPGFYARAEAQVRETIARRAEAADAVARLYERWEELLASSA
jgi:ATP-binding cassette subfamily F protein uup